MASKPKWLKPIKAPTTRPKKIRYHADDYGPLHEAMRLQVLSERPFCERCLDEGKATFASHAHHIRYPAETLADYIPLCPRCHNLVHRELDGSSLPTA